ncbi:MAG: efflux transporter outer membrane subunit [Hyphomonas sp.]|jgi:NodT family efflux transporter outer membrane factor (OMF) lipoprotein|uniref:efflux transporter outer membrane subunit n=1 Tax=Hyphomonas sp. TaxID=87 RepID=UPI00326411B9|tara:strand:+ start:540 stop:1994 length:1455 start_codon:yes stop_codon:yes gene_type:complete
MTRSILLLAPVILAACASSQANLPGVSGNREEIFAVAPEAPTDWASVGVAGQAPTGDWLSQFDDPIMENLVREALANSPTLESRAALVRAAQASIRTARSQRLPSLDASVSTGVTSNSFEVGSDLDRTTDGIYGLGLDASWEADLWNRLGRGVAAAEADLAASEADLAAAELSVAAQTAIAWINLNAALAQERVAILTYEARDRVRMLTERRFQRGLAQALDVRTARSALAGAEAEIARRRQLSGEAARRLEILLGRYPATEIEATADLPILETLVAEGNPMLLLSRRPDVASAEASIVAAGLRAEQARLAMLPALRLTGSISTSESEFADMVDPERIAARLVASLVQPLFTGGRLDAQRDAAVAQAEAAIASYAGTALTAWGEVEDAIAADTYLAQQEDAQMRALEEARLAEELAERQYTSGTITVFNLIDAQTRRLTSESQLVSARATRASNRISYHLALGGGLPVQTASTTPQDPQEYAAE